MGLVVRVTPSQLGAEPVMVSVKLVGPLRAISGLVIKTKLPSVIAVVVAKTLLF